MINIRDVDLTVWQESNNKTDSHSDSELRAIFALKNIAVVGISKNQGESPQFVPKYLIERGYNVIPVNPYSY